MLNDQTKSGRGPLAERVVEATISNSRWLLVPFHFGLLVSIVTLLAKFAQLAFTTLSSVFTLSSKDVIIASLSMIEFALIANLLLMVIFSSYGGFVSKLDAGNHTERLSWRDEIGFGALKVRVLVSVAAISGVYLLEKVIDADETRRFTITWAATAFVLFVVSAIVLAVMEWFSEGAAKKS